MQQLFRGFKRAVGDFVRRADLLLLALCTVASIFGLVAILSAANPLPNVRRMMLIQTAAVALGLVLYIIVTFVNLDVYGALWKWLSVFNVAFIALLFVLGKDNGSGNRSWLVLPFLPFSIQPAEVVKITFILLLAKHFTALGDNINKPLSVLSLLLHLGLMCGLIMAASDDMGITVVYVFIFFVMALCSRLNILWLLGGVAAAIGSLPLLWNFVLKPYQKERIFIILDPDRDPLNYGWQAAQSKIALRSGGLTGMGLFQGTQTQSKRLPFAYTDFIYSAIGEELGLLGCLAVTILLLAIIVRCLAISLRAKDMNGRLVCIGVAAMLIFQTFENIGMCLGLTPIIGLTLPFFSYGGSSIITLFLAMGLISSVKMHPKRERNDAKAYRRAGV